MPTTVSFNVSAPCAGGEHMTATATLDRDGVVRQFTTQLERTDVRSVPPSEEDLAAYVRVSLRLMANQGVPLAQLRNRINSKIIDLTI